MKRNRIAAFRLMTLVVSLSVCTAAASLAETRDATGSALSLLTALPEQGSGSRYFLSPDRLALTVGRGDVITLIPPSETTLGGTSASVYTVKQARRVGRFQTEIQIGPDLFTLLGQALEFGAAATEEVAGEWEIDEGTIRDRHAAYVFRSIEVPRFDGYDVVLVAVADGVLEPGEGRFHDATGTSSLFLMFELDLEQQLPPLVRAGTFLFDFD